MSRCHPSSRQRLQLVIESEFFRSFLVRVALFLPHLSVTGGLGVHARGLVTAMLQTAQPNDLLEVTIPSHPERLFPQSGLDTTWHPLTKDRRLQIVPLDWPANQPLSRPLDAVFPPSSFRVRPDVFYSSYYTGLQNPPCPQAVTFHDAGFLDFPEIFGETARQRRETMQMIGSRIASLVCVSDDARQRISRALPFELARMDVVHHALSDTAAELAASTRANPEQQLWPDGDRIADWGRYFFSPVGAATGFNRVRKNLPNAVAAYRQLPPARMAEVRFIIASTGIIHEKMMRELLPESELKAGYMANGAWRTADDRVRVLPNLDRQPFLSAMAHSQAVVYPSRYEGFGLPTIEAMAVNVPAIASRATSIPEVAGDAAWLVEPDDVAGFRDAMQRAIEQPEERTRLIARGQKRAEQFTLAAMGRSMWQIFHRILKGHASA
jgi:glycosyltransferase involved in cell wall biosynthesis